MKPNYFFAFALAFFSMHSEIGKCQNTLEGGTLWNGNKTECEYTGWALNTVFNLPGIRFNIDQKNNNQQIGTLEYFNSIGAGVSLSRGTIHIKSSDNSTPIPSVFNNNTDVNMKNIYGISIGFLFSKSNIDSNKRTIFAPVLNFQLLDFQIGIGYELGDVSNSAHRTFVSVAYGLPISKLINTGSFLLSKPWKNSQNGGTEKVENIKRAF